MAIMIIPLYQCIFMFSVVDNSLQKTAHDMFPAALTTQLSPAFPSMQELKIQDSQRRWKLSGESKD